MSPNPSGHRRYWALRFLTAIIATLLALGALTAVDPSARASAAAQTVSGSAATSAAASNSATTASQSPLGLGRNQTVTWDSSSLMIDGKRVFLWSAEFHYWRLPSPSLWRDVLEKIKASGYNAVQIYFDWGFHSPKQGVYDFTGVRDVNQLLTIAAQVGLYVLARPGPYINAETDAGWLPDWVLADNPLRTDAPCTTACPSYGSYLSQAEAWLHQIDQILAHNQLTNGTGPVILYQVENELNDATASNYMADLAAQVRSDGITVPIYTNDPGLNGAWVPSSAGGTGGIRVPWNDLYAYDDYPQGFSCTNPTQWSSAPDRESTFRGYDLSTPMFVSEFQGGSVDSGSNGFDACRELTGPDFERVFEQTNFANGVTMENNYMTFGGTSWGGLVNPTTGYTSYDYGAMLTEGRQLTPKYYAQKEIGYFLNSVTPLTQTVATTQPAAGNVSPDPSTPCTNGAPGAPSVAGNVTPPALTNCGAIQVYHRVNPTTHTNFYFARHTDSRSTLDSTFTFPISTDDGSYTVPQNGRLELNGRDMKTIVADFGLDTSAHPQHLVYSTSNIMTSKTIGGQDVTLLWAPSGQSGETALRYTSQPTVETLQGAAPAVAWNANASPSGGDLVLDYPHTGLTVVRISGGGTTQPLLLLLTDDPTAQKFWTQDTPQGSVLESGPELVRTATVADGTLALTGDTSDVTTLRAWAPSGVTAVTWNGSPVAMQRNTDGSLTSGQPTAGAPTVPLPTLANWTYQPENPEAQPGFNDTNWAAADHTTTNNPTPPASGQPVLYTDDYGFHHGAVWYRGHFTPAAPLTSITINSAPGTDGITMAWLNGTHLSTGAANTYAVPLGTTTVGADNVLSVLVLNTGHDQYVHVAGQLVTSPTDPRGLTSVSTVPSTAIAWKIQGTQGGEDPTDTVRGPMNNGGLYGERAGWYLSGYPATGWKPVTLPHSDTTPGVAWYRTSFTLHEPAGTDVSIGLNIADATPSTQYTAEIFLNGWNMGLYRSNGPQHTFVLPNGILHTGINDSGQNTLAIAVLTPTAADGSAAGGLETLTVTDAGPDLGAVAGGVAVNDVQSPSYRAPKATGVAVSAQHGTPFTGTVATVTEPADALGTANGITVDWGDGTASAGTVTGHDGQYTVCGTHTYSRAGTYIITTTVADRYGATALATAKSKAQVT